MIKYKLLEILNGAHLVKTDEKKLILVWDGDSAGVVVYDCDKKSVIDYFRVATQDGKALDYEDILISMESYLSTLS